VPLILASTAGTPDMVIAMQSRLAAHQPRERSAREYVAPSETPILEATCVASAKHNFTSARPVVHPKQRLQFETSPDESIYSDSATAAGFLCVNRRHHSFLKAERAAVLSVGLTIRALLAGSRGPERNCSSLYKG